MFDFYSLAESRDGMLNAAGSGGALPISGSNPTGPLLIASQCNYIPEEPQALFLKIPQFSVSDRTTSAQQAKNRSRKIE